MATYLKRGNRITAWVRKGGHQRSQTFGNKADARAWADLIEAQIEELRASGVREPKGMTVATLIDRYVAEFYAAKPWGRSKAADLARLKKDLGAIAISDLNSHHITNYFRDRHKEGAGGVTISAAIGYLIGVLEVARSVWHLNVPLQAARDARLGLSKVRLISKSARRDRRVSDREIKQLIDHFASWDTSIRMADVLRFCIATGMRISEVCRLEWRDLNESDRTVVIRDRKHPSDKLGNDQTVPLLNLTGFDAYEIVEHQRPVKGAPPRPRIFPFNSKSIGTYFALAVAALKLDDLHLHDLRHEAISRLFEAGLRIEQVALVSGHRDWAMLKRYVHLRAVDLHEHVSTKRLPRSRARAGTSRATARVGSAS